MGGRKDKREEGESTTRKTRRRSLLLGEKRRGETETAWARRQHRPWRGGRERGGQRFRQSAASFGWCCCCSGRGDDAATLLGDGSAGGGHVVLQPGESPRSPAEGRWAESEEKRRAGENLSVMLEKGEEMRGGVCVCVGGVLVSDEKASLYIGVILYYQPVWLRHNANYYCSRRLT